METALVSAESESELVSELVLVSAESELVSASALEPSWESAVWVLVPA